MSWTLLCDAQSMKFAVLVQPSAFATGHAIIVDGGPCRIGGGRKDEWDQVIKTK